MSRARRAALLLAGLDVADRDDVLARLPRALRERVVPHLDELRALGARPGYDWIALLESESAEAEREAAPVDHAMQTLMDADAEIVGRALGREPVALVAAVLSVADWPWRERFLAACDAQRRSALTSRARAQGQMTAAVRRLLLAQVARRVARAQRETRPDGAFEAALEREGNETHGQAGWRQAWAR